MSRKSTTPRRRSPRKSELLAALRSFTRSVSNAHGIRVTESGGARRRGVHLDTAYKRACRLLNERPAPVTKATADGYEAQADYLVARYWKLVDLAQNRGYSGVALAALVMSAWQAELLREAI